MNNKEIITFYRKQKKGLSKTAKILGLKEDKLKSILESLSGSKVSQIKEKEPLKTLFYDIETSPNLVLSWQIGSRVSLGIESIVKEREIICICWKWEGENKIHSLEWNNGEDKELVRKFSKVLESANVVIGHNSDSFDNKVFKGRCLYHHIPIQTKYKGVDTLKISRRLFKLNSNKLDYIARFLGLGQKPHTGFQLWKDIVLKNDKKAMKKMVDYCKNDVILLEKIYKKLDKYNKK